MTCQPGAADAPPVRTAVRRTHVYLQTWVRAGWLRAIIPRAASQLQTCETVEG